MDKFFGNLHAVLGAGLVLAIALMFGLHGDYVSAPAVLRWLHLFFGIVWIGLLYYFNFVQIPTMPSVPAELKPGVSKYIAPKALFWFRWGAAFTVLTGLAVAAHPVKGGASYLVEALTLDANYRLIGVGMWLALIMAFNVWFVIWPAQKKALGLVEADDAAKAKAAKTAMIFSRTNTLLSIPMLYAMVSANHG
ncbi:MAG TPA: urate hydroxylase PuuD [Sphingopyxis sp.]|nr:urate hydroxylase PuuD [Sphingopyxis sp.]HMP46725.1 urate hydroxylase PuuD [Sphingopyxis sp.]HMQ18119.1 urate hydroxylase PuuD [Sphingopyxis sp.]